MRLTGDAARKYLQDNPNAAFTDNRTGQAYGTSAQTGGTGFLGNLLQSITKPFRQGAGVAEEFALTIDDLIKMARGENVTADSRADSGYKYGFLNDEESQALAKDPLKVGLKSGAGVAAYGIPGGSQAATVGGRIAGAAGKGAISGGLAGFGASEDDEELMSALKGAGLGGLIGGAMQGVGEGVQALTKAKGEKIVDVLDVDDIAKLPNKTKSGLVKQAKSAGFWDSKLSESTNIQNFLKNRGFAGDTPAETLEALTQEFNKASQLKQEGLEDIGGLSRGYLKQVEDKIDDAFARSGLSVKDTSSKIKMKEMLRTAPQDAKSLDSLAGDWYDIALTKAGEQKMSQSGLFKEGAKALRDTLRSTPDSATYDTAMKSLYQILGIEDVGTVSGAAKTAASAGVDIPFFSGAGFKGADIKTPMVSNTISKTQAALGRAQEVGMGGLSPELAQGIQGLAKVGQQVGSPMAGQLGGQLTGQSQQVQPQGYAQQEQGVAPEAQAMQAAMAQAIFSGQITVAEAEAIMGYLGMSSTEATSMPKTDSGRKAMVARDSAQEALVALEQDPSVAGKLQGLENIFYDVTGQANAATGYKTLIEGIRSQVFNALGGTALSPTEKKQYEKFLPKMSDSKEQAQQKLRILIPMMESLMGTEVDTPAPMQYGEQQY